VEVLKADILILGAGGAGLFAALHAYDANPRLKIVMATKGLIGKGGCSRMVQGGLNVVLNEKDSLENHFKDTLKGGGFINNQELAWTLVSDAPKAVHELEVKVGCFFDRGEDGRIHQKPFAGQSFDRTVHVADLTGIQLISRMTDQIYARNIQVLEETRGLDLLSSKDGHRIVGALLSDIRTGEIFVVNAKVTIVATGGCASMYKISAPSFDKTGDGMAMCFRAGAEFVDMEMVQFHPTGLVAGRSRLNGSLLEEGLRGSGARLYNGLGERFMERYDPERLERSTRDRVARSSFMEIMAGRGTENNAVYLDASHMGAEFVEQKFPGMVERVKDIGKDLAREKVEVTPTAHYQMGGVRIDTDCQSNLRGLLACGEDAGGVHGANRLGGNGICDSTVYGRRAGDAAAALAVVRYLNVGDDTIARGLDAFRGLPHRLEFIGERDGVRYYNDSKSTTPESTMIAVEAFVGSPVIVLVGGQPKGASFAAMGRLLARTCKRAICYGRAGSEIHAEIAAGADSGAVAINAEHVPTFDQAVHRARELAQPGDIIVLSPACASYDEFANYEQRGETFRRLVQA